MEQFNQYQRAVINGDGDLPIIRENSVLSFSKLKELLSFPYFQASVMKVRSLGMKAFCSGSDGLVISDSDEMGEREKITQSGRRIMAAGSFCSVEENDAFAQRVIESRSVFQLGAGCESIDEDHYLSFESLIDWLQKQNVEVVFYLPSWYPDMYGFFASDEDYMFIPALEERLRETAEARGIEIRASYDPQKGLVEKTDFVDMLHLNPEKMMENYQVIVE